MPVAVALGGDPIYTYSATAPLPENVDEYMLAGFLRKKKVELVKCITQPEIEVPADADIIIEGYVDPNGRPDMGGPLWRSYRLLLTARLLPALPCYGYYAPQGCCVPGYDSGHTAAGRCVAGQGYRAYIPYPYKNDHGAGDH
jgi:hypothetical protein